MWAYRCVNWFPCHLWCSQTGAFTWAAPQCCRADSGAQGQLQINPNSFTSVICFPSKLVSWVRLRGWTKNTLTPYENKTWNKYKHQLIQFWSKISNIFPLSSNFIWFKLILRKERMLLEMGNLQLDLNSFSHIIVKSYLIYFV